jgi:hypothetical protein
LQHKTPESHKSVGIFLMPWALAAAAAHLLRP